MDARKPEQVNTLITSIRTAFIKTLDGMDELLREHLLRQKNHDELIELSRLAKDMRFESVAKSIQRQMS